MKIDVGGNLAQWLFELEQMRALAVSTGKEPWVVKIHNRFKLVTQDVNTGSEYAEWQKNHPDHTLVWMIPCDGSETGFVPTERRKPISWRAFVLNRTMIKDYPQGEVIHRGGVVEMYPQNTVLRLKDEDLP